MNPPDDPFMPLGRDDRPKPERDDVAAALDASARSITPDPTFRAQLWEQLMDHATSRQPVRAPRPTTPSAPAWAPRLDDRPAPAPSLSRRVRRLPYATLAALLIIGLIAYAAASLSNSGSTPGAGSGKDRDPIVGTWVVTGAFSDIYPGGSIETFLFTLTLDNGGGAVATWYGGSTAYGIWTDEGDGRYDLTLQLAPRSEEMTATPTTAPYTIVVGALSMSLQLASDHQTWQSQLSGSTVLALALPNEMSSSFDDSVRVVDEPTQQASATGSASSDDVLHGQRLESVAASAPHIPESQTEGDPNAKAATPGLMPTPWSYPTMTPPATETPAQQNGHSVGGATAPTSTPAA